jgi:molecular chaperone DnaK
MECVAIGAAIQASILSGEITDMVLLDVTPLTLGIETLGGVMTPLIERNTTIPTKKGQIFSTASDFQTAVTIHVLQGERPMAGDNISLGQFNLVGIPPAPRGVPQIDVTFDIDASGILNVSAKDLGTGKEQKMTISASTKLSDREVNRMVEEAKKFEEEDKKKKEEVQIRNDADAMIYTAEKTIAELSDKLSPEQKEKIDAAMKSARTALEGTDHKKIKEETEKLQKVLQEAGTAIYAEAAKKYSEQAASAQSASEETKEKPSGEKVVDADFKMEEEK